MKKRFVLAAVCAGACLFAAPLPAQAVKGDLYWANTAGGTLNGTIGHAKLDGSRAKIAWLSTFDVPCGVAVDRKHLYWADASTTLVNRVSLNRKHTNYGFLEGAGSPCGVAVTAKKVFAANQGDPIGVVRGPIGGGSFSLFASELFDSTSDCGVAVNATDAFWVNNYEDTGHGYNLERAPLDHPGIGETVATVPHYTACGLAVAGKFAYVANGENGAIDRVSIRAKHPVARQLVVDLGAPCGVAVAGNHIYWADAEANTIGRANLDGTHVKPSFISTAASVPCGIASVTR